MTSVLTDNFLLLLLYFGCTTTEYSIWVSPSPAGSGSSESSSAFYGVFIAEGIAAVGDKGSVGTPVDDK
jgi:hypothetical protein